jgi:diacylglycerol kinase (ATP)
MVLLLNPQSGGGRAAKRWSTIRRTILDRFGAFSEIVLDGDTPAGSGNALDAQVARFIGLGERQFVAAGGDGTLNALVNSIMRLRDIEGLPPVALGAIGLGSSNDFHKQRQGPSTPSVPFRIQFDRARMQDLGRIDARSDAGPVRRYFIVNASLGVTAEGNVVFNGCSGIIGGLKRMNTGSAIAWAALSAIARHANAEVHVSIDGSAERPILLSNLAVMKNPSISGGMRAVMQVSPDDGRLGLWIEEDLSRPALLKLFFDLNTGRFRPNGRSTVATVRSLRVRGAEPFAVEFDGEILYTDDVHFTLLPRALEVCQ